MSEARGIVIPPGLVVAIIMALFGYAVGGIWWASTMDNRIRTALEDAAEYRAANDAENLRQWARINGVERTAQDILASNAASSQALARVEEDLRLMRGELKATNDLLREVLISNARRDAKDEAK